MAVKSPPHPCRGIKEDCLQPLGLSVTEAAEYLGVARHALTRVLDGHTAISPEMAIRLEKAGWSSALLAAQACKGEYGKLVERYESRPMA